MTMYQSTMRAMGGLRSAALVVCATLAAHLALLGAAAPLTLSVVTTGLTSPRALDYEPSSDRLIVAVGAVKGERRPFEAVTTEGRRNQYGPTQPWPADAPVLVARDDAEFEEGHLFTSRGVPGQIVRLDSTGRLAGDVWARLPGETGNVTALAFSYGGLFERDMLAGTSVGHIWRIGNGGRATFVAAIGAPISTLLAVPADPRRYGEAAGKLLVATSDPNCQLITIDALSRATSLGSTACVTDLDLAVPDSAAFFAASFTLEEKPVEGILTAAPAQFTPHACSVLATYANGGVAALDWSSSAPAPLPMGVQGVAIKQSSFVGNPIDCQPEICGDDEDNDADGEIDEGCVEICGDGIDNDSDGEVDNGCAEICGNREDDDRNGQVDEGCVEICGDRVDNDGDEFVDAPCPEVCGDKIDNDRNGQVDERCPQPAAQAGCPVTRWRASPALWAGAGVDPKEQLRSLLAPLEGPLAPLTKETVRSILDATPAGAPALLADARALVAETIAAILNAHHEGVGYPIIPAVVVEQTNAALQSGQRTRIAALTSVLEAMNELGCTLTDAAPKPVKR